MSLNSEQAGETPESAPESSCVPRFQLADIEDGRRLHYLVEGPEDAPLVLYDAGAFGIYADGWWVKESLKPEFRVCLYDRAGMGASDPVPDGVTPTPRFHVEDMRRLLSAIGETRPFILIGHSMAGMRLHAYANLYPEDIRGLVFVDAISPRSQREQPNRFMMKQFNLMLQIGSVGANRGLAKSIARLFPNNFQLDQTLLQDKVRGYAAPSHYEASKNEVASLDVDADYLSGDGVSNLPVAIFAATMINDMTEQQAEKSKANTGYGWFGKFPREDHVSILMGVYAEAIAARVREIDSVSRQADELRREERKTA